MSIKSGKRWTFYGEKISFYTTLIRKADALCKVGNRQASGLKRRQDNISAPFGLNALIFSDLCRRRKSKTTRKRCSVFFSSQQIITRSLLDSMLEGAGIKLSKKIS